MYPWVREENTSLLVNPMTGPIRKICYMKKIYKKLKKKSKKKTFEKNLSSNHNHFWPTTLLFMHIEIFVHKKLASKICGVAKNFIIKNIIVRKQKTKIFISLNVDFWIKVGRLRSSLIFKESLATTITIENKSYKNETIKYYFTTFTFLFFLIVESYST